MAKLPSPDTMRKRFWELKGELKKVRAKVDPLRAEWDKLQEANLKKSAPLREKLLKAQEPLFEIEQEMASLVRAVGGRMGEPQ